jgi:hypothetical protein
MTRLVPNRLLFHFELPLHYAARPPKLDKPADSWPAQSCLPALCRLDDAEPFGRVWLCWHETGLYVACRVADKRSPLRCDPKRFWQGDNLRLMTNTRPTRTARRASRFCQHWYFLPTGGGRHRRDPAAATAKVNRALEDAPLVPAEKIPIAAEVTGDGYSLSAHLPAETLVGFDPGEHDTIGLYYMLEDTDHGQQFLTVGDDLLWNVDPSTWASARLER